MKHYLSILFVLLLAVGLLGACSETAEPEEKAEPVEVKAEEPEEEVVVEEEPEEDAAAKEEEAKAEEEAAAKAKEAEAKEAEEAAAKLKAEEEQAAAAEAKAAEEAAAEQAAAAELEEQEAYVSTMRGHIMDFSDHMGKVSTLSIDAGNDPYLMRDQDWIMDFALALVEMDTSIEEVRSITAPDSMQESHNITLQAMDEFKFVVENMPLAVDNLDADLIDASSRAIEQGTAYLGEATNVMMESVQ